MPKSVDEHVEVAVRNARFELPLEVMTDRTREPGQRKANVGELHPCAERSLIRRQRDQLSLQCRRRVQ